MESKDHRSESSECSYDSRSSKTHSKSHGKYTSSDCHGKSSYTVSSQSDRYDCHGGCDDSYDSRNSRNSCDNSCDSRNSCDDNCGLKHSVTPVGVWNLVYASENGSTTTGTVQWLNQLLLNGDETATTFAAPEIGNVPFPFMITNGVGVWKRRDRKIKLELTNIGFRHSDGAVQVYYRIYIVMKTNDKGTRARFRGEACPFDISDPTMCTPADHPSICFQGCAVKVLEPC